MTAHIQHLILYVFAALPIESKDLMLEALPLGLLVIRIVFGVRVIGAIDETEIRGSLQPDQTEKTLCENTHISYIVEVAGLSVGIILQEVAGDGGILYKRRGIVCSAHRRHQDQNNEED